MSDGEYDFDMRFAQQPLPPAVTRPSLWRVGLLVIMAAIAAVFGLFSFLAFDSVISDSCDVSGQGGGYTAHAGGAIALGGVFGIGLLVACILVAGQNLDWLGTVFGLAIAFVVYYPVTLLAIYAVAKAIYGPAQCVG